MRMHEDRRQELELDLSRSLRRIEAANLIVSARLNDFFACVMIGTDSERQQARAGVMSAHEALLDAYENNAWIKLEIDGIDPMRRGYQ